eukprot:SAG25_NODE_13983_length_260_cov_0.956522_1_plen_28_part_01
MMLADAVTPNSKGVVRDHLKNDAASGCA